MDRLLQDLRFVIRTLRRAPGFALVAVITLGIGIGATTAILTVTDAALLRRLPVERPQELRVVAALEPGGERTNFSYPLFASLRLDPALQVAAMLDGNMRLPVSLDRDGAAVERRVHLVSDEYFGVLGVRAAVGQFFDGREGDDTAVAVLRHEFWRQRFAGDPSVVGRTLVIDDQEVMIIGVAAEGFSGEVVGRAPDLWVPLALQPRLSHGQSYLEDPNVGWLQVMARLRPDMTSEEGEAALALHLARLQAETGPVGQAAGRLQLRLLEGQRGVDAYRQQLFLPLLTLLGMISLVLLIVCANISNLLLARGMSRRREIGIRVAVGADRARLIRQLLTESVVIAALGGVVGLFVARWGIDGLILIASGDGSPLPPDAALDPRALLLTVAICLVTVVVFGLAPAFQATKGSPGASLRSSSRGATPARLSRGLVVAQVALSVVLLSGAALLASSSHHLRHRDVGFASEALLEARVDAGSIGLSPPAMQGFARTVFERVAALPGIEAASLTSSGFQSGVPRTCCIAVEGYPSTPGEDREIWTIGVAPGYFRTIQQPLRAGRDFNEADAGGSGMTEPTVAIVNEAFVRRYLRGRQPIGARFGWGDAAAVDYGTEIVGVVADAVHEDIREEARPVIYQPRYVGDTFVLRTAGDPDVAAATLRRALGEMHPELEVEIRTVSDVLDASVARERLLALLSGGFAIAAVLLAAIGLYGLVSYLVTQRRREIGIRISLGATGGRILRAEVGSALSLASGGIAIGVVAVLLLGGLLRSQLYGISAADPRTLGGAAAVVALLAVATAYLPARRAARVDPVTVLGAE